MKKTFLASTILLAATSLFAATATIYQKPDTTSKSVGQYEINQLKPFYKKDSWTKVGNIQTGEVGWVESSVLQSTSDSVNDQLAGIQQAQAEAKKARAQFEQQYQQMMQQLNQKQQSLLQQSSQSVQAAQIKPTFKETYVSYSSDAGKNGTVKITEKWSNKDGKLESKTYEMPIAEYNKKFASKTNNVYQQMMQRQQQMEAYMSQVMQQMSQQFGQSIMVTPFLAPANNQLSTGNSVIPTKGNS